MDLREEVRGILDGGREKGSSLNLDDTWVIWVTFNELRLPTQMTHPTPRFSDVSFECTDTGEPLAVRAVTAP